MRRKSWQAPPARTEPMFIDPTHSKKVVNSLTARGVDLLPVIVAMSTWGQKHDAGTPR
jgi:DNA-binding HxlR family transcriptional regulator